MSFAYTPSTLTWPTFRRKSCTTVESRWPWAITHLTNRAIWTHGLSLINKTTKILTHFSFTVLGPLSRFRCDCCTVFVEDFASRRSMPCRSELERSIRLIVFNLRLLHQFLQWNCNNSSFLNSQTRNTVHFLSKASLSSESFFCFRITFGFAFPLPALKAARKCGLPFLSVADTFCCHSGQDKDPGTNAFLGAIFIGLVFRCYGHFCTTAKHWTQTLCQAFCAMPQQREFGFSCIWTNTVHGAYRTNAYCLWFVQAWSRLYCRHRLQKKLAFGLFNLSVFVVDMDLQSFRMT